MGLFSNAGIAPMRLAGVAHPIALVGALDFRLSRKLRLEPTIAESANWRLNLIGTPTGYDGAGTAALNDRVRQR